MDVQQWISLAFAATKNSYSPYSKFKVGACVALKNGDFVLGTNIENAAYGSSMCAERNAIYSAYCQGYHKEDILSLTIVADCSPLISPCGACRQVLGELLDEQTPIILANKTTHIITNMAALLPMMFTDECL